MTSRNHCLQGAITPHITAGAVAASMFTPTSGPLCPQLYHLLEQRVGPVRIVSQGEAFMGSWVRDGQGKLRVVISSPGEYYRVSCPYCSDTRHRLWVNHTFGQMNADNNRRMTHLAHCYNEDCLSKPGRRRHFEDLVLGFRNAAERVSLRLSPGRQEPSTLTVAEPPGDVLSLARIAAAHPEHPAAQYMLGVRRYALNTLEQFGVQYCIGANPKYRTAQDRVIFPILFNNRYVGWQARFVGDVNWGALGIPKYYTMPGFHKRLCLYNYDTAKHKDFVVVTEGVNDVHAGGEHFVALFGKTLSQQQRMLLLDIGERKPIIFLLDADAREEMEGMIGTIAEAPGQHPVVAVNLPDGFDPGNYDRITLWNIIRVEAHRRGVTINFTG